MSTVVGRGRTRGRSMFVVTVRRMTADGCRANGELARRSPRRPQSSVLVGALGSSTRRAATTWSGLTQIPSTVSIQDVLSLCAHRSISVWALISPVPTWRLSPVVRRNSMSVSMRPSIRVCSYHRVPRSHPCLPPSYSKSRNRATTARRSALALVHEHGSSPGAACEPSPCRRTIGADPSGAESTPSTSRPPHDRGHPGGSG